MADYEELRRRKLEENRRKIDELKLSFLSASLRPAIPTPSPRKLAKRKSAPTGEGVIVKARRSSRVANLASPNHKEVETKFFYIERAPISSYRNMELENRVYASDEARAYTVERAENLAEKLEPRYPYFVRSMLQSHVTGGFWLGLPRVFCMTQLPKRDSNIYLIDESGIEHRTLYLASKLGLSAGWRGFSISHELVDGDALVFQLVKPTTFKIYIIRVKDYNEA